MTEAEFDVLCKYVREVADEMGLRDWHFNVFQMDEIPEGGLQHHKGDGLLGVGGCTPITGAKRANITFREDFREKTDAEDQREIVVHELTHCHVAQLREFARTGFLDHVTQTTYDAFMFGYDLVWEFTVDGIARPWSQNFPLIPWPTEKVVKKAR